jgi:hypothetical protein
MTRIFMEHAIESMRHEKNKQRRGALQTQPYRLRIFSLLAIGLPLQLSQYRRAGVS